MARRGATLVVLFAVIYGGDAVRTQMGVKTGVSLRMQRANPIRRVVKMLQAMQGKISEEGRRDEEIFEKFMCYCNGGGDELKATVSAAKTKLPQVESALQAAVSSKAQLEQELEEHNRDREAAKDALARGKALREKEAAEHTKAAAELQANLGAVDKALAALGGGGAAAALLQSSSEAQVLGRLALETDITPVDRDMLSSFLSEGAGQGESSGGAVQGVLKTIREQIEKDLQEENSKEQEAQAAFEEMAAAKKKEVAANSKAIEVKMVRNGELGVAVENYKEDFKDTSDALEKDEKFLKDLAKECKTKEAEFEIVKRTRGEELVALGDTIKILNDDDALDLFKKTLPSPSLLQTQVTTKQLKREALQILRSKRPGMPAARDARLDFIALSLRSKKADLSKVIAMIDKMVKLLGKEQTDDDSKKAYCEAELDQVEDEAKEIKIQASDIKKAIQDAKATIERLGEEIGALEKGIRDLDKSVADATATRKEENEEFKKAEAADNAAKELLKMAKNRLNKFYNPKLASFSQASTAADSSGDAPPPPPEAVGAYQKKGEASAGVLDMLDGLAANIDKEMQEMSTEEADSQAEYEAFIKDSADKRAADAKSMEEKEGTKADLEAELEKRRLEGKAKDAEYMAKDKEIFDLHKDCDWILQNYETRRKARAGEVESLDGAKAALSGADESLLQTSSAHRRLLRRR